MRYDTGMGIKIGPVAVALQLMLVGAASADAAPLPVVTLEARAGGEAADLVLDGSLQAVRQATLAAQVAGNVQRLAVQAGDRVRAGQLVAVIDERDAQAALARSQAAVAEAEALLRNAELHAQRTRELRAQGFVSQAALDVAETSAHAARAAVQQARAARTQAALVRGHATVTAPFAAVVLATHVEAGDLAAPGRALVTVYAPGALRAVVDVPASRAAQARQARQVQVLLPDGRVIEPGARTLLPGTDPVSQTVQWRLDLPASAITGSTPGQAVQVRYVSSAAAPVAAPIVVPPAALLHRGELTAVYVVQGERFVLRAVRAGVDRGRAGVEIWAGLAHGERIAADAVRAGLAGAVPSVAAAPGAMGAAGTVGAASAPTATATPAPPTR